MVGAVIAGSSLFAFILLWVIDLMAVETSPYLGILTYIVSPGFLFFGALLVVLGWFRHRRRLARAATATVVAPLIIDFSRSRDRAFLIGFIVCSAGFLLLTAIGSYESYHITKTVKFCGETCHVMDPEYTAYKRSAHARVDCVACHIAPGASGFVQAKLGGLHQVYGTILNSYKRPLDVSGKIHVDHKTCEQCHWPQKFHGRIERTFSHYLSDNANTPYSVRLSLNVGGADPTQGPAGGIHWHMHLSTKVEYIALDPLKQKIPWVRLTDSNGKVTEFRRADFKDDISKYTIRRMDCIDCHNHPAHKFNSPTESVDQAMTLGKIDPSLPGIKREAVLALTQPGLTSTELAMEKIATRMHGKYPSQPKIDSAIAEVQDIFKENFFPAMNTDWKVKPNNIGHKNSPGCFRCHDGKHVSADRTLKIKANDCNACHTILSEGRGSELDQLTPNGRTFKHPEEGWDDLSCSDCHDGTVGPEK